MGGGSVEEPQQVFKQDSVKVRHCAVDFIRTTGREDEHPYSRKKPAQRLSEKPSSLILTYDINPDYVLGNVKKIVPFTCTVNRERHHLKFTKPSNDSSCEPNQVVRGYHRLGHARK